MKNRRITFLLNICIVLLVIAGTVIMLGKAAGQGNFISNGFANLRYFTVLSNLLCGVTALITVLHMLSGCRKKSTETSFHLSHGLQVLKLVSAAAVGVTFFVIAAFLGPIYGHASMYQGSNLFFHLIVPLVAMAEFILLETEETFVFRNTWFAVIPTILYGICYVINLFINGIDKIPNSNDWYGFLNWGLAVGSGIFLMIILISWLFGVLLWKLNKTHKR